MFDRSDGFTKDFYLWMIQELADAGLVYHSRYFDSVIGRCCTIWEDPFLMIIMGHEL